MTDWKPGDLALFYGRGWKSRAIEYLTGGPSHVGIILAMHGAPLLYESTTLCDLPCEILNARVRGVQAHNPTRRVISYDGPVWRLPLRFQLWPEEINHLTRVAFHHFPAGTPYDLRGALESGPKLKGWRTFLPYPDMASVFCSALCAALLQAVGRLNKSDPKQFSPADLVSTLRRTAVHEPPELVKG